MPGVYLDVDRVGSVQARALLVELSSIARRSSHEAWPTRIVPFSVGCSAFASAIISA